MPGQWGRGRRTALRGRAARQTWSSVSYRRSSRTVIARPFAKVWMAVIRPEMIATLDIRVQYCLNLSQADLSGNVKITRCLHGPGPVAAREGACRTDRGG